MQTGSYAYHWERSGFDEETWRRVDDIIRRHKDRPGALIPVLEEVQGVTGYLPEPVLRCVAAGLDLPLGRVYGVATFYSFFSLKPRGKCQIKLCLGTACHVRGAKKNLDALEAHLGIAPGECTPDGEYGLEVVRCLGACGLAPVMVVGDETHRQVKAAALESLISRDGGEQKGSEG